MGPEARFTSILAFLSRSVLLFLSCFLSQRNFILISLPVCPSRLVMHFVSQQLHPSLFPYLSVSWFLSSLLVLLILTSPLFPSLSPCPPVCPSRLVLHLSSLEFISCFILHFSFASCLLSSSCFLHHQSFICFLVSLSPTSGIAYYLNVVPFRFPCLSFLLPVSCLLYSCPASHITAVSSSSPCLSVPHV